MTANNLAALFFVRAPRCVGDTKDMTALDVFRRAQRARCFKKGWWYKWAGERDSRAWALSAVTNRFVVVEVNYKLLGVLVSVYARTL